MYASYFGLNESPFSITPDPRYLYMSRHHHEALAHLLYGVGEGGGFVQLTGEVGTGKTTLCRCLLEQLPSHAEVALILNPRLTALELLKSICDELEVPYPSDTASLKALVDTLNDYLLRTHAEGRRTVLIIDEAQNLTPEVLEQIRLLTNLETTKDKLLQIILIGQPELNTLLGRRDLRQLAQRVTARYHLRPLSRGETHAYIGHRMEVGGRSATLFTNAAARTIHRLSGGIPRLINVICDRALLGAYAREQTRVGTNTVRRAAAEVLGSVARPWYARPFAWVSVIVLACGVAAAAWVMGPEWRPELFANTWQPFGARQPAGAAAARVARVVSPAPAGSGSAGHAVLAQNAGGGPDRDKRHEPGAAASAGATERSDTLTKLLVDPELDQDKDAVFANLFSRWSVDYRGSAGATLCERAQNSGLECLRKSGNWGSLRSYNLPALLELVTPDGNKHLALVSALQGDSVTLDFGREQHALAVAEVDRYWRGDYLLVWKRPPLSSKVIAPGVRSADVLWLRAQLGKLKGGPAIETGDAGLYDEALKARVIAFQRSRSLQPDGIVGEQTLIHLSTAFKDPSVPLLSQLRP
jgi:general secretion pathway protein A